MIYWTMRVVSIIAMVLTVSSITAILVALAGIGVQFALGADHLSRADTFPRLIIIGMCFAIPSVAVWLTSSTIADAIEENR